jgi:hypothetical protein
MEITEDEIRRAAGHPDAIPKVYIECFVMGALWMKNRMKEINDKTQPLKFEIKDDTKHE